MYIAMIMMAIVIIFISAAMILTKNSIKKERLIYSRGIEADGIVDKVESKKHGSHSTYKCFVKYFDEENVEHEGILNVRVDLPVGRKVRVRYLPGNYENIVFVSQEINLPKKQEK